MIYLCKRCDLGFCDDHLWAHNQECTNTLVEWEGDAPFCCICMGRYVPPMYMSEPKSGAMAYQPDKSRVAAGTCVIIPAHTGYRFDGKLPDLSNNSILMLQRVGSHGSGTWSVPGGWISESDATIAEAAAREVWEEVGIVIKGLVALGTTLDHHPEGLHGLTIWHLAYEWEGIPRNTNPDRATTIDWWARFELDAKRERLFLPFKNALEDGLIP